MSVNMALRLRTVLDVVLSWGLLVFIVESGTTVVIPYVRR